MSMRKNRWWVAGFLLAAACSEAGPAVDLAEVPEGWDEHRRRQNVTVRDANGGEHELSPDQIALYAGQECAVQLANLSACSFAPFTSNKLATSPFEPAECHVAACEATLRICVSHQLMELAEHRDPEFEFGAYRYPVLDAAERATTHESALFAAREAMLQTATALTGTLNHPEGCNTEDPEASAFGQDSPTGELVGTVLADAFVEAFHLTREAAERSFRSQLAVADGQRSLRRSDRAANTFGQLAPVLSRGAAAQLVTQAPPGFNPGVNDFALPILGGKPLADTRLRGDHDELALQALREAAINPEDLMNDALSIDDLIGGDLGAPPLMGDPPPPPALNGSVLQRLEDLHGQELGANATDLYRNLRVTRDSFIHARDYLRGQVRAFARNPSRTLPPRERPTDTGVHSSRYARFGATASRPTSLPAAYWSALASASRESGFPDAVADVERIVVYPVGLDYARSGLAAALDYAHSVATLLIMNVDDAPTAVHGQAFTTASAILNTADDERPARIVIEGRAPLAPGYPPTMSVRALAMEDDDLVLLRSLDGAQCAERGVVDGLPCDINDYIIPRTGSEAVDAATGFQRAASWNVGPFMSPGATPIVGDPPRDEMFFLGRLGDIIARPGLIDILGATHFPPDFDGAWLRPANPWLDAMAKEALEPSPNSPTDSNTHCSGLPQHLNLPLENELSDDGDGIESSWRTYLRQAQLAADEADRLGDELIRAGLEADTRAETGLEGIESACGAAIDLDWLSVGSGGSRPCGSCLTNEVCHAGRCVADPVQGILDTSPSSDDSERAKLRACLDSDESVDYVTLGNRPLCFWVSNTNPNDVCGGASESPCPFQPEQFGAANCASAPIDVPAGYTLRATGAELGFFDHETPGATPPLSRRKLETVCTHLRLLRGAPNPGLTRRIQSGSNLHLSELSATANTITAVAQLDSHLSVEIGTREFTTGSALTGTTSTSWPCSEADRPASVFECAFAPNSLLCHPPIACGVTSERLPFVQRFLNAVITARAISGVGMAGVVAPSADMLLPTSHCSAPDVQSVFGQTIARVDCVNESGANFARIDAAANGPLRAFGDSYVANFLAGTASPPFGGDYQRYLAAQWSGVQGQFESHSGSQNAGLIKRVLFDGIDESQAFSFAEVGYWNHDMTARSIRDAVELLCDAQVHRSSRPSFGESCGDAPVVRSASDLPYMQSYLQCLADEIDRYGEMQMLRTLPRVVVDRVLDGAAVENSAAFATGGEFGSHVNMVARSLAEVPFLARRVSGVMRSMSNSISSLHAELRQIGYQDQLAELERVSAVANNVTSCVVAGIQATVGFSVTAPTSSVTAALTTAATCANAGIQTRIANRREGVVGDINEESRNRAVAEFSDRFDRHAADITSVMERLQEVQAEIDAGIIGIDSVQRKVSRSVAGALFADSDSAGRQYRVSTVMRRRLNTLQARYEEARTTAIRRAELARRAVENRLAVDLSTMVEDLPIVEAPARWVDRLCEAEGIDFRRLRDSSIGEESYAPAYIGDYVRRLDSVVESYRLRYPFSDGRDTAVVSIKNEIDPEFARCDVAGPNLLLNTLRMTEPGTAWIARDCEGLPSGIPNDPDLVRDCITVIVPTTNVTPVPWSADEQDAPQPVVHRVIFGPRGGTLRADGLPLESEVTSGSVSSINNTTSSLRHDVATQTFSRLSQEVVVQAGRKYRLSWYERRIDGPYGVVYAPSTGHAVTIIDFDSLSVPPVRTVDDDAAVEGAEESGWSRRYMVFDTRELTEPTTYEVAIGPFREDSMEGSPLFPQAIDVAGLMLEDVTDSIPQELCGIAGCPTSSSVEPEVVPPREFWGTNDRTDNFGVVCEDVSGDIFRSRREWVRGCELPCDASAMSCLPQRCYRQLAFSITGEQERSGRLFRGAGFAHDNYNYRVESVGLNVVGTGVQNCEESPLPTSCYASGYVAFDLTHVATKVLDHGGRLYPSSGNLPIVAGGIRGGRALVAERQVTNPLSGADRGLVDPYMREELRGRPLAGDYTLRIYEDDIVFDAIEDIQMVIDYRYWTPAPGTSSSAAR